MSMKFLTSIDGAIIDNVYQPIANRLSWLMRPKELFLFCLMGDIIGTLVSMYLAYISNQVYFGYALGAIILPVIYISSTHRPDTTSQFGNPMRIITFLIMARLASVISVPVGVVSLMRDTNLTNWVFQFSFFLYVCFMYFEACNAPPPREQKKPVGNLAWNKT